MTGLFRRLRALAGMLSKLPDDLKRIEQALAKWSRDQGDERRALARQVAALRAETRALATDTEQRFRQHQLQIGRLTTIAEGRTEDATFGGRLPVTVAAPEPAAATPAVAPSAFGPGDDWLTLATCPGCGTADRTVVCEWNKLVLLDTAPDQESWVYDYAVCHGCGVLYATRRPHGRRYRYLMDHFEDVIEKAPASPGLNPHPLTEADRADYRALIANGVWVSSHLPVRHIGVLKDRLDSAGHVDLLGSLLDLRGARVLEVRSRAGTIVEGLRRLYGAEVYAMPIFESQQFVLKELYGIDASALIDFDRFSIPFEGPFDLIACNHMFNHAVRLDGFLAAVRQALRPGGHLYLYNEIDDSEFIDGVQSMVATMNPLHLQAADDRSLVRALAASGFETRFTFGRKKQHLCLVQKAEQVAWEPMRSGERRRRIASYQRARDRSVLRVPAPLRPRFSAVWPETVARAVTTGLAVFDEQGAIKIVKEARR